MAETRSTRRRFLMRAAEATGGLVVLSGAGYAGYSWPRGGSSPAGGPISRSISSGGSPPSQAATDADDVAHFVSRPDLTPPRVTMTRRPTSFRSSSGAPRHIFVSPKGYQVNGPGQPGLMVVDTRGQLVWFQPLPGASTTPVDLQVQTYQGKPVLTWWQGTVISGYGQGTGHIADSSYREIATVRAGNGLQADLHELNLTPQGTALITAYRTATADLSKLGGPSKGQVLACQAQEIDVATGRLLLSWDSLDHVPVTETYQNLPGGQQQAPFDYFHINSVALAPDGDLLISARNTWAVYKVDRSSGKVVWRLNGRHSDFTMAKGARFYWQHHVRAMPGGRLSVFDDGASPPEEAQSRGIVLGLDTRAKRAHLVRQYLHPARLLAANQGSMQTLDDGRVFIGWGNQPYFSEFTRDGTLVLDGRFPANDQSYRAFTSDWSGHPTDDPALAVQPDTAAGLTAYASWNGATGVDRWQVLAGKSSSALSPVASALRAGFETVIAVNTTDPYLAVVALDRNGRQLGRSKPVRHP